MSRGEAPARAAFPIWERLQVRWGDMDALGHVNNAVFFTYCESARMRYFERLQLAEVTPPGQGPVLASASCTFRQQVRYPAELEVGLRVAEVRARSFTMEYGIFQADSEVLVGDGASAVVWIDFAAGKAAPLPEALRAALGQG